MTFRDFCASAGTDGNRGAALVELAVTLPMLVMVLVGAADFGRVFYTSMALTNAARAGAQYGAQSLSKSSDIAGMRSAASSSVSSENITGLTTSASATCLCWTDDGLTSAAPSPNSCAGTCAASSHLVITVTVVAQAGFSTIVNYPGVPHTLNLTRTAALRAQ
jgi:Flp pilus assembly protein TadG